MTLRLKQDGKGRSLFNSIKAWEVVDRLIPR